MRSLGLWVWRQSILKWKRSHSNKQISKFVLEFRWADGNINEPWFLAWLSTVQACKHTRHLSFEAACAVAAHAADAAAPSLCKLQWEMMVQSGEKEKKEEVALCARHRHSWSVEAVDWCICPGMSPCEGSGCAVDKWDPEKVMFSTLLFLKKEV